MIFFFRFFPPDFLCLCEKKSENSARVRVRGKNCFFFSSFLLALSQLFQKERKKSNAPSSASRSRAGPGGEACRGSAAPFPSSASSSPLSRLLLDPLLLLFARSPPPLPLPPPPLPLPPPPPSPQQLPQLLRQPRCNPCRSPYPSPPTASEGFRPSTPPWSRRRRRRPR